MSKIKNFLNKAKQISVKDLTSKTTIHHAVEKVLIPRLKAMGFILLSFSLCSLFYAYFSAEFESPYASDGFTSPDEMQLASGFSLNDDPASPAFELTVPERLNFYFVAFVFASTGTGCILLSVKKKREHLKHERLNKD